jgi:hypothetical protein
MDLKINIKRKFKVNGKEYDSMEEMPAAIREAYEKALVNAKGPKLGEIAGSPDKIVFNGQQFESMDAMPDDIRQMYETMMKSLPEGSFTVHRKVSAASETAPTAFQREEFLNSYTMPKPIGPKPFLTFRAFIVGAAVLVLLMGIYWLLTLGSR